MPLSPEAMAFFLFGLFVVGDLATTAFGLVFLYVREGNPFAIWLFHEFGVPAVAVWAAVVKVGLATLAFHMWLHAAVWTHRVLALALAGAGLWTVLNNTWEGVKAYRSDGLRRRWSDA